MNFTDMLVDVVTNMAKPLVDLIFATLIAVRDLINDLP
jgi:hypothetical protein